MKISKESTKIVIEFEENLTAQSIKELKEVVKNSLDEEVNYDQVVTDLSQVEYIDSTGITFIIGIYKSLEPYEKKLTVIGARQEIKDLFNIIRLDKIFSIE